MTDRYPDPRDLEGLYNQANNLTVTDNMVMIDRQELADLRRQLAQAHESLQAAVELIQIREEQLRDELARVERAETQLAEAQTRIRQQDIALDENRKMVQTAGQGWGRAEVEAKRLREVARLAQAYMNLPASETAEDLAMQLMDALASLQEGGGG